ncbi:sugar transferase [Lentibacillus sp. Marseille-P4043]|uniref:sugar transferase n=1 Tax=Lentibacillus sp. Marseille-P4043 TaxID=2040293 RepID=UPI000D0B4CD8|nr:sugar transferase [Lentibacillus sp. Marseille-P4043]
MEIRQRTYVYSARRTGLYRVTKRVVDVVLSIFLLVVLAPVTLVTCFFIYKKDGQPFLLKQARAGKHNRMFVMWTFRTTTIPSRVIRALPPHPFPESWADGVPSSFTYNTNTTTRVTQLGSVLRKYHINKIPQLINVVKGDMSLVGPQPEIPEIADYYNERQQKRLLVRPGIMGYAQVNGAVSDSKHRKKIAYDLYYIRNCTFRFDMKIMYHTIARRSS